MGVNIAPRACFIIGLISFISYFLIFLISLSCYYYAINRYTRRIFLLLSLSVLFQLPWYSNFILHRSPNGRIIYSFHMISSIFYFSSFSFVCFAWGDVLRTKNYELLFQYQRREQIRKALILSNIGFICLTIIIIYYCITSNSLEDFFQSKAHYVFAGFDVIKNILMGIFIAHFGHNLRSRLMNYYHGIVIRNNNQQNNNLNFGMATTATTTTNTTSSPVLSGATLSSAASSLTRTTTTTSIPGASSSSSPQQMKKLAENTANLIRVNQKLIILVIISIFSFLLKALALIMWKRYTSPSEYEPPTPIEHRWVFWWIVFEIFPVALPALAFFFTMGWPSKLLTSFVILFPASIKNDPTGGGGGGGGLGGDGAAGCGGGESEYDEHGRTRSSEIEDSHHRHSHHRQPNNHYPKDDHTGGGGGVIQITSSHMVSPLSKSLLRESYDEGGGDDDCFHVMNRLSTLSGELIDIELDRDTLTAENEGDEEEQKDSISQQHEETKSFTSSTSGRFQFRFPSISSRT